MLEILTDHGPRVTPVT